MGQQKASFIVKTRFAPKLRPEQYSSSHQKNISNRDKS